MVGSIAQKQHFWQTAVSPWDETDIQSRPVSGPLLTGLPPGQGCQPWTLSSTDLTEPSHLQISDWEKSWKDVQHLNPQVNPTCPNQMEVYDLFILLCSVLMEGNPTFSHLLRRLTAPSWMSTQWQVAPYPSSLEPLSSQQCINARPLNKRGALWKWLMRLILDYEYYIYCCFMCNTQIDGYFFYQQLTVRAIKRG